MTLKLITDEIVGGKISEIIADGEGVKIDNYGIVWFDDLADDWEEHTPMNFSEFNETFFKIGTLVEFIITPYFGKETSNPNNKVLIVSDRVT